jgi:hypothetical protein
MRTLTLLAVLATAVAAPLPARAAEQPLLGIVSARQASTLVRVDQRTLRPVGSGVGVGSGGCASRMGGTACWSVPPWSWSPDRSRLVLARNASDGFTVRSLRFVDPGRMRVTADVPLSGEPVGALAWLSPSRLLALQEQCCEGRQRLLVVDVAGQRIAARRALDGSVLQLDRAGPRLVLLLARGLGPASVAVVDASGDVRSAPLGRVVAGTKLLPGSGPRFDSRLPGLPVDPRGGRAFVVDRQGVAVVDLRSLAVTYHVLARVPAKEARGYARTARWLGNGVLAVAGHDATGTEGQEQPAGLVLVDTRTWKARTVDPAATDVVVDGKFLVAPRATGLGIFGRNRLELFEGERVWLAAVENGRAYVGGPKPDGPLRVVDLATGRIVGTQPQTMPSLLTATASGWWG